MARRTRASEVERWLRAELKRTEEQMEACLESGDVVNRNTLAGLLEMFRERRKNTELVIGEAGNAEN